MMLAGALGLVAVLATRAAEAQSGDSSAGYDQWVAKYAAKSLDDNLVEITLVNDERASSDMFHGDRSSISTFAVKSNGKTWRESVAPQSLTRLRELVSDLPADAHLLPPPERRILIQAAAATRVYDLANLPDAVVELLRISNSGIGTWHYTFKSQRQIDIRTGGPLLLAPDGKRLLCGLDILAIPTYEPLGELELEGYMGITISSKGTIAALIDSRGETHCGCLIFDPSSLRPARTLEDPRDSMAIPHDPSFTPNARGLVFSMARELRYYDTTTWQRVDPAPGIPADTIQWNPSKTWRHAVMITERDAILTWDAQSKTARELDKTSYLHGTAFSPDESLVAIATTNKDRYSNARLRIFKTDTGQLADELRFNDIGGDGYIDPQWTPDGRYVLAVTKPRGASHAQYVSLWSAKSGRHRADFDCDLGVGGVLLPPPGDQLIVSCGGGLLRFFDFAAAIRKISAFEDSLATSTVSQPSARDR
jgi:WD40 repeat protein